MRVAAWRGALIASSYPLRAEPEMLDGNARGEVAAIASGVERRRRPSDVLADDGDIADLAYAARARVARRAPRIVRSLGLLQRPSVVRDRRDWSPRAERRPCSRRKSTDGRRTPSHETCRVDVRARWPPDRDRPGAATLLRARRERRARPRGSATTNEARA
jgi:hypothetical protein